MAYLKRTSRIVFYKPVLPATSGARDWETTWIEDELTSQAVIKTVVRGEKPHPTRGDILFCVKHNWSRGALTSKKRPAIPLGSSSSSGAHQQTNAAALRTLWPCRWSSLHDNGRAQMLQLAEIFGQEKENSDFKTRNQVMNCVDEWMTTVLWGR